MAKHRAGKGKKKKFNPYNRILSGSEAINLFSKHFCVDSEECVDELEICYNVVCKECGAPSVHIKGFPNRAGLNKKILERKTKIEEIICRRYGCGIVDADLCEIDIWKIMKSIGNNGSRYNYK
jgi:hypothetical protein